MFVESRRAEEAAAQLAEQNEEPPPPVSPAVTGVVTKLDMQNLPETVSAYFVGLFHPTTTCQNGFNP